MPFRSRDELADWLAEFGDVGSASVRVIEQDGSEGNNTGLVAAELSSGLDVYIQPDAQDSRRWVVTIEPREDATELSAGEVTRLASEFATVAALCAYLEEKSLAVGD